MLDHSKFVLHHIEKCGGTFIIDLLISLKLKCKVLMGHDAYKLTSKNHKKKKIGLIRNPFAFYLSLWSFGCQGKGNFYSRHMKLFPEEQYLYNDSYNYKNFRLWLKRILNSQNDPDKVIRVKPFDLTNMKKYQIGLLTVEFIETYFGKNKYQELILDDQELDLNNNFDFSYFIKIEDWTPTVIKIIKDLSLETEIPSNKYQNLLKNPDKYKAKNISKHDTLSKYYDQECLELVIEKDKYIFQKFNYPLCLFS